MKKKNIITIHYQVVSDIANVKELKHAFSGKIAKSKRPWAKVIVKTKFWKTDEKIHEASDIDIWQTGDNKIVILCNSQRDKIWIRDTMPGCMNQTYAGMNVLDFMNLKGSRSYNPIRHLCDFHDIQELAMSLVDMESREGRTAYLLYMACIFYLLDCCEDESQRKMRSLRNMINAIFREDNGLRYAPPKSRLDELFDHLPEQCTAKQYYIAYMQCERLVKEKALTDCLFTLSMLMDPLAEQMTFKSTFDIKPGKPLVIVTDNSHDYFKEWIQKIFFSQLDNILQEKRYVPRTPMKAFSEKIAQAMEMAKSLKTTTQDKNSTPSDENAFSDLQAIGDAFADMMV